jgi:hypothetical protein
MLGKFEDEEGREEKVSEVKAVTKKARIPDRRRSSGSRARARSLTVTKVSLCLGQGRGGRGEGSRKNSHADTPTHIGAFGYQESSDLRHQRTAMDMHERARSTRLTGTFPFDAA